MNVWGFLGLDDKRKENKTVQLVKNYEEVNTGKIQPPFYGQVKKDGVYALIVAKESEVAIFGRTGKAFTNVEHLEAQVEDMLQRAGRDNVVMCAELCCDSCSLEVLSGIVNPNRTKPLDEDQEAHVENMGLYFFDTISLNDFIEGESNLAYYNRLGEVEEILHHCGGSPFYPIETKIFQSLEQAEEFGRIKVALGEEGVVIKSAHAGWVAGNKGQNYTKIVRGVDFDLEVVGVEQGKGKREGMVANLIVRWRKDGSMDNEPENLSVDGRFNDLQRIDWWNAPEDIVGKIVHVHALQIGSKGSLRLAKVRAIRIDKTEADL